MRNESEQPIELVMTYLNPAGPAANGGQLTPPPELPGRVAVLQRIENQLAADVQASTPTTPAVTSRPGGGDQLGV